MSGRAWLSALQQSMGMNSVFDTSHRKGSDSWYMQKQDMLMLAGNALVTVKLLCSASLKRLLPRPGNHLTAKCKSITCSTARTSDRPMICKCDLELAINI